MFRKRISLQSPLFSLPSTGANRDLTDYSGKKPLDYRKLKTSVSASTYSSEYPDFMRNRSLYEEREHLGRESTGFLLALTYPRRKGQAVKSSKTVGPYGGKVLHEKFMAELRLDDERQLRKKQKVTSSFRKPSRTSMISLSNSTEDTVSLSAADRSQESGTSLSRSGRTQQSFLRKKFGSMGKSSHKTKRSSFI